MKALRKAKHMLCLERSRLSKENWPKSLPKSLKREKNIIHKKTFFFEKCNSDANIKPIENGKILQNNDELSKLFKNATFALDARSALK